MTVAILSKILLLTYYQIVEWVDLFPWNNLSTAHNQRSVSLALGSLQLVFLYGFMSQIEWLMGTGLGAYLLWMVFQVANWWVPYFRGASERHMQLYSEIFGKTYKFLPAIGNHPVPDTNHIILHFLLLTVIISASLA